MKKLLIITALLMAGYVTQAQTAAKHCKGTTAKSQPCKSTIIKKGAEYCNSHDPAAVRCSGKSSKGKKCGNKVNQEGDFCRFHKTETK